MREALHTNAHRLEAVNAAVAAGVTTALAQVSGCHRTTLYRWKKRREEIAAAASSSTVLKPGRRGPKVRFPDLEQRLMDWIEDMRCNKVRAVTTRCLLMMSIKLEQQFLEGRSEAAAIQYLRRSRTRNQLSIRRITHKGRRKRSEGYEKYEHLFNMDQTSIYVDMNPKMTITGCKVEAEVHMNTLHKEGEAVLAVQKNAYCDERVMLERVKEVWKPSVTFCRVLLLGSLKVHKMSTVRAQLEDAMADVEFVPPGATTLAQPMDVAVMAGFKRECRELYAQQHCDSGHSATPRERPTSSPT
ncbi:hypothetical protein PHYSODRAFT_261575 [Phytophthora sojae]|uniref:DDE-1 domain-containing protein n=1 Tax=Phytophthora sojae (strain P6497) TaxID=1094619 RepID=G4YH23_PHYSP|nr:hypothetical protein PHYSODRAFT_261575 [Phytophthora sojae]EGZ27724.1 hypothetical protein PHYSODRAFT_261575 [Phytophthora sojae]|eukprot:XP_009514999.1 hypothetical protein PHYSODRAFT_261575 [Phytophthora sojae]